MDSVTVRAPTNIAVIKYWGKRNSELNLPMNGSISVTLDVNLLNATTSVVKSTQFENDRFWLNGREQPINSRIAKVLQYVRGADSTDKVHIVSVNNFPTSAGLASSAAGLCALACALCALYGKHAKHETEKSTNGEANHDSDYITKAKRTKLTPNSDESQIREFDDMNLDTTIVGIAARLGSGSACRSIPGGIAEWTVGDLADGTDSIAHRIDTHSCSEKESGFSSDWNSLRILILVTDAREKHVCSREAMLRTAGCGGSSRNEKTEGAGRFLAERVRFVSQCRLEAMRDAIKQRQFTKLAELTVRDSNELHAVVLADPVPPVFYLTDRSRCIIEAVHAFNERHGEAHSSADVSRLAYTFDAGPNACLLFQQSDTQRVFEFLMERNIVRHCEFSSDGTETELAQSEIDYSHTTLVRTSADLREEVEPVLSNSGKSRVKPSEPIVRCAIYTKLGGGPQFLLRESASLADEYGLPKQLA